MAWESEGDYAYTTGDEANVVGRIFRRGRRGPPPRPRRVITPPRVPQAPSWNVSRLRSFMGVGFASFAPTDATDKVLPVQPQESFEGRRVVVDSIAAGGTSAGLVVVRRLEVGTQPQAPSVEQPAPASMFSPTATYSYLDLQIAYRATRFVVTVGITAAPGAGVTVTASSGAYGNWIR